MSALPKFRIKLLCLLVFIAPLIGLSAPLGLTVLIVIGALACLPDVTLQQSLRLPILTPLVVALVWAAITLSWTTNPSFAAVSLARTLGVMMVGFPLFLGLKQLPDDSRQQIDQALMFGLALACLPSLATGFWLHISTLLQPDQNGTAKLFNVHLDRGQTILALLLFPMTAALWDKWRRRAILLCILVGTAVLIGTSLSAKVALLSGGSILLCARFLPRRLVIGAAAASMLTLLLAGPALLQLAPTADKALSWNWFPVSSVHRLIIWNFAKEKIADHPLVGWGYESSRDLGHKQTFYLDNGHCDVVDDIQCRRLYGELLPLHPHNFALQIRMELGIFGSLLFAAMIAAMMWSQYRRQAIVETAVSFGAFLICMVAYGFWQSWWLASLWLVAGLCHQPGQKKK